MKKIILGLAAVSALAIGAPAAAQYAGQPNGGYQTNGYNNEANGNVRVAIARLQVRLDAGIRSGGISRREAYPLRQQIRQLTVLERQYGVNGLSGRERADLQQRLRDVRQRLRLADGNGANWNGYDREDGYGQNGQYGDDGRYGRDGRYGDDDRMDANRDGYDDRDHDRDGRWDDDVSEGRYQQPGGTTVGGVLDQMLGGGTLRVGQRASSDLYAVPSQYRSQYRDGNDSYYRSDGRQIYQIDARSQTVVRIYPMNR